MMRMVLFVQMYNRTYYFGISFFLPFLMRWQDIDILDYAQKQVIYINHHLTVYTVKATGESNAE